MEHNSLTKMNTEFDFDEASREWRKNKVSLGNGYFAYRCKYIHSNGKTCNKIIKSIGSTTRSFEYCQKHIRRGYNSSQ